MAKLRRSTRVRVNRPGGEAHGHTGAILNDLLGDSYWIGLDERTTDGRWSTIARRDELTALLPEGTRVRVNLPTDDAHGAPGTIGTVTAMGAYLVTLDEPTFTGRRVVFAEPWEVVPMFDGEITCSPGDRVRIDPEAPHPAAGREATVALEVPQFHDFDGRKVCGYLLDIDGGTRDWVPAAALTPLTGATPGGITP